MTQKGGSPLPVRSEWTSQRAFIISSVAAAVGLGNLWRFPYMVGENGGGTFILCYLVCLLAVGLPLFTLETAAGSLTDRGPVGVFRRINGRYGSWLGWFIVAVAVALMSYYLVITGWTLGYLVDSIRGDLKPFEDFTSGFSSVWYFLVSGVLVFLILRRGTGSIEILSKVLMPALVVMVALLAIYSRTLSGSAEAMAFYTSFDLALFLDPQTWRMAAGQAFFSLGVGTGVLITYGSYIPRNVNILASSAAVTVTNSAISLTAGVAVFSIIYTFGIAPDTGSQLSFTAFPQVFGVLPGGRVFALFFFGSLFVAAFSSSYSLLAVAMAPLRYELGLSENKGALVATGAALALGIPSALSFTPVELSLSGRPFLEWADRIVGSGVVVVVGFAGAALIAWMLPRRAMVEEMTSGWRQTGPMRLLPYGAIEVGKYVPAAALVALAVTAVF